MRVRCLVGEYSYVERDKEYDVYRIDKNGRYYFAHVPTNHGYDTTHFSLLDDTPPVYVESSNGSTNTLVERITQLEAKIRQLQDQLDHHDHKTPIDFTVETEIK